MDRENDMGSALSTLALLYPNVPRERGIESGVVKDSGRITPSMVALTPIFDASLLCMTALQLVSRRARVFTTSVGCGLA